MDISSMLRNNKNNSNLSVMIKSLSLGTFSSWKSQSSDNLLTSGFIKESSEKESLFGMIKCRKNSKSAEWSSFMLTTWRKSTKSRPVIFLPFSEWSAQQVRH